MGAPRRRRSRLHHLARPKSWSRRDFLKQAGSAAGFALAAPLLSSCGNSAAVAAGGVSVPPTGKASPFIHGVASGDPMSDRVILWTRATPVMTEDIAVMVKVYRDTGLTQLVGSASQTATAVRDWTVKIDFTGLAPATTYYYQFEAAGFKTRVARTRTAPSGAVDRLRFGLVSCSSLAHGYFNAYAMLAKRADIDVVLHLGDYIYEYGSGEYGNVRPYEPATEMITLADYRTRHSQYKRTDEDLQELHRQLPFVTIWDDHESADNSWRDGANNHTEGAEGSWPQRKAWAQQAYDEWMPIRYPEPGNINRIWRKYSYGNLVELFMTDTRLYERDLQVSTPIVPADSTITEPDRVMLGTEQRTWLLEGMAASTASWKLVGNQVVFHQWNYQPGPNGIGYTGLNGDSWDAYKAERGIIIDALRAGPINNVVLLTGDVHTSWVADITEDPNNPLVYTPDIATTEPRTYSGSVAVEYVVTSITSPGALPDLMGAEDAFAAINPHIKKINLAEKGYSILDVTPEQVVCEYWFVSTIAERGGNESFAFAYPTPFGENRIRAALTGPTTPPANPPPLAP